ncbi:E3 ubiquitin-protein ligase hakai-like protein [Thalictrum thalictroides]|uniref:RING-type E3 ubiquitin transferase n=1 Tax=Thalictrum thalictroides TaxID=46969 RepID=A0A7J6WEE0_THATH|nr:E3 ubiquitin-protein ligase hakai-like protein [Thalictrum thalictroides]
MLQIRLSNKGSVSEATEGGKTLPVETVTVACPDHLVLADLPVAKGIGTESTALLVKIVGRRSRRHLGERVHFCVRCDFPIAIYGRLGPCEHAFCLDCARSDSSCYLCDERIQKIQTIKMMEGIFICAAPHCLKSFLKKSEFETHIHESHADLLHPNLDKEDGNELVALNVTRPSSTEAHTKQSTAADASTARSLPKSGFSPSSTSQPRDLDDKTHRIQPRDQISSKTSIIQPKPPPFYGRHPNYPPELQQENNPHHVFDWPGPYNRFHNQQNFDAQAGALHRRDSDRVPDKEQRVVSEVPFPDYPPQSHQPPNFIVPLNTNQGLAPAFNMPPFPVEGLQPFYNVQYEATRPDMQWESGPVQGTMLGCPPAPAAGTAFSDSYSRPWNSGAGMPFEQMPASQGNSENYANQTDAQGSYLFPSGPSDNKDGKGTSTQPSRPPPARQSVTIHNSNEATSLVLGVLVGKVRAMDGKMKSTSALM